MVIKVLFVCLGNICRSPTAEGVFRNFSENVKGLTFEIDSCGTIAHHVGESPDPRSVSAARLRGYDLSAIRSRKIVYSDLRKYDYVFAMDNENLNNLFSLADNDGSLLSKIDLFLRYSDSKNQTEVPDPYYGGNAGFDHVIDLIENASSGFLKHLSRD